jgi:hypothetical protein
VARRDEGIYCEASSIHAEVGVGQTFLNQSSRLLVPRPELANHHVAIGPKGRKSRCLIESSTGPIPRSRSRARCYGTAVTLLSKNT